MSRSGYSDECEDNWARIKWRGMVASATRGKRGQSLLRDMLAAMDAMPIKELVANELEKEGSVCALGALGRERGIDMADLDPEDSRGVATAFGIAEPLAQEIVYMNDECGIRRETPAQRFERMRAWISSQIKDQAT